MHQPTNYITESNTARLSNPESKERLLERYKRETRRTNAFERQKMREIEINKKRRASEGSNGRKLRVGRRQVE